MIKHTNVKTETVHKNDVKFMPSQLSINLLVC